MGIRVTVEPRPSSSRSVSEVVRQLEDAAAAQATKDVSAIWPGSGKSAPVARGNEMVFEEAYAKYVRRSGGHAPLMETEVPQIAATAADETFTEFVDELTNAVLKEA